MNALRIILADQLSTSIASLNGINNVDQRAKLTH